jgi:hypothetical protein
VLDLQAEHVVTLSDATRHLPKRSGGKKPHVATLYRWATRGLRGVRLETIRVGGTLCTSLEALQIFCERLSGRTTIPIAKLASATRRRAAERAERMLDQLGI